MVIIAIMFLIAGLVSVLVSGMKPTEFVKWFGYGVVSVLPAVLLILMASSVKYTLIESNMLDTLLFYGVKNKGGIMTENKIVIKREDIAPGTEFVEIPFENVVHEVHLF